LHVWRETVQLPDGHTLDDFYTVDAPDFVCIFPAIDDGRVLCLRSYRHGPRRVVLGLPSGYVNPGEEPLRAAQRELREETGYTADSWAQLGTFAADGNRGGGRAHIYLARHLTCVTKPASGDLEEQVAEIVALPVLAEQLHNGQVDTLGAATAIALGLLWVGWRP
jgi:ADP-ribose pyrophosphatase